MNNKIVEETVLFVINCQLGLYGHCRGTMVGLSTAVIIKILVWSGRLAEACHYYFLLLPAAMVISVLLVTYLAPDARKVTERKKSSRPFTNVRGELRRLSCGQAGGHHYYSGGGRVSRERRAVAQIGAG
jgi:hypothetical protein